MKPNIDELNRQQNDGKFHPFTCCGGNSNTPSCLRNRSYEERWTGKTVPYTNENEGVLISTESGWVCPCGEYKQNYR
jgi:hypothetical protein